MFIGKMIDIWFASVFYLLWTWEHKYLLETLPMILSDTYPEVELPGHLVILFFRLFEEPLSCSPQWQRQFTFLQTVHKGVDFSVSFQHFWFSVVDVCFFNKSS